MSEIKDRLEEKDNVCDRCKWRDLVSDIDFPCSNCIHNRNHVKGDAITE